MIWKLALIVLLSDNPNPILTIFGDSFHSEKECKWTGSMQMEPSPTDAVNSRSVIGFACYKTDRDYH